MATKEHHVSFTGDFCHLCVAKSVYYKKWTLAGGKVWHYHTTQYSPPQSERLFSQRYFFLFLLLLFVFTTFSPVVVMESRALPHITEKNFFLNESKCSEDEDVLLASLMLLSLLSKTMQFKSAAKCLAVCCLLVRIYDCLLCFLHISMGAKTI